MAGNRTHTRCKLSIVVIAKNEAERIDACLKSVSWADEIVVVDSGSSDSTCEIARCYTDKVFDIPWCGFGPQKQAAVDLASNDWILNIDCDERVTTELAIEIRDILASDNVERAYSVPRRTFLGSREIRHCGWYPDRTVRLFDRRSGKFSTDPVHERVVVEGEIGQCRGDLLHYSFTGIDDILTKMRRYTDLSSLQLFNKGRRFSLADITLRPLFAFFKTFVLRAGFLDGVAGLTVSAANCISVFVKYLKLRELELAERYRNTGNENK
jgi:glycosyltransferase involved in cell wall biosynthesis